jgi:aminoglycoside phosphotransferase (APT) family kinase protein
MPQPIGRDLEKTRDQLAGWLRAKRPEVEALGIENLRGPKDTGFSSDTLMFDLHYTQDGARRAESLVIRLEPAGDFGIFPEYDVALQFNMMRALADTKVPVPKMLWLEEDRGPLGAPFYVMEKLEGSVPSDSPPYHSTGWIVDLAPDAREALWWSGLEAMAAVHELDWQDPKFAFIRRPEAGRTPLCAQLDYWDQYLSWGMERERYPLLEAGRAWLEANQPAAEPTAICWGDSRISNQIFDGTRVIAVIDWEMLFLGNPVADLAWFTTLDRCLTEGIGIPRLEGMPDVAASVSRWEQHVGREAEHFDYYVVFAAWRFSALMARIFLQMKHYEILPQEANVDANNLATVVLERAMDDVGAPRP